MAAGQRNRKKTRVTTKAAAGSAPAKGELLLRLNMIATELQMAYATCVTVEGALASQGADQDEEIAFCLRFHVGEPLHREMEKVKALARRISGAPEEGTGEE
jgi:hypothetical protein